MRLKFWQGKARPSPVPARNSHAQPSRTQADPVRYARVKELADSVPFWFHSLDFGEGVVTPGVKSAEQIKREVEAIRFPDLAGKTVLDIGAWDGAFSFEAERRGARRVLALDHYVWSLDLVRQAAHFQECQAKGLPVPAWETVPEVWHPDTLPGKKGFDTACLALDSKVESVVANFMEGDLDSVGQFDVVLFLGVLYHMPHPLLSLQRLASVTRELAIIETAVVVVPGMEQYALCEFYETDELNFDPTNWWAPNRKALEGLCRAAGFRRVDVLGPAPSKDLLLGNQLCRNRFVAHAWK